MKLLVLIVMFGLVSLIATDYTQMSEKELLSNLKKIPSSDYEGNAKIYRELYKKDYTNIDYRKKLHYYGKKLEEQKNTIDLSTDIIPNKMDCKNYENQYSRYLNNFNKTKNKNSIHMLKSVQDDLLKYCGRYINITHYQKQKPLVEKIFRSYY